MLSEKRVTIENLNKKRYDTLNQQTSHEMQQHEQRKTKAEQKEQELLARLRSTLQVQTKALSELDQAVAVNKMGKAARAQEKEKQGELRPKIHSSMS